MNLNFWRLHTFVPPVVIPRDSTWSFLMVSLLLFVQLSHTTPYSKSGRKKLCTFLDNTRISRRNVYCIRDPFLFQAFVEISDVWFSMLVFNKV